MILFVKTGLDLIKPKYQPTNPIFEEEKEEEEEKREENRDEEECPFSRVDLLMKSGTRKYALECCVWVRRRIGARVGSVIGWWWLCSRRVMVAFLLKAALIFGWRMEMTIYYLLFTSVAVEVVVVFWVFWSSESEDPESDGFTFLKGQSKI